MVTSALKFILAPKKPASQAKKTRILCIVLNTNSFLIKKTCFTGNKTINNDYLNFTDALVELRLMINDR